MNVSIAQRRFAMDDVSRTGERWNIPIVARSLGGAPARTLLAPGGDGAVSLPCGPYLVNAGQSGFFRVKYDDANFRALTQRFDELESIDQLGLLLDYWNFGRSGDAAFTDYLVLVSALPADADPVIVMHAAASMTELAGYARGRAREAAVRAFGVGVLHPYFEPLGWDAHDGESSNRGLMRAALIGALGSLGDRRVIEEARRRARASLTDAGVLPAAIRAAALGVYAANASMEDYEDLLGRARAASDFVEQRRLWLLIASARDSDLAQRTLAMTLGEAIPRQIRTQVISAVAAVHPRMGWDFLVANRAALEALYNPQQRLAFPAEIAALNADLAVAHDLELYATGLPESARRGVAAAVAAIRLRAQTMSARMPAVEAWIAQNPRRRTRP